MKKLLLTAVMATAGLLAGLAVQPAAADTRLQLVEVITSPERTEVLKKLVAGFEQENPGVKVDIVSLPWGQAFEKLLTMVQAGQRPDVVEMPERWSALYVARGELESLEPWLAKWPETEQLAPRVLQFARLVHNTAYSLPYGFYIRAMFYNKKLFQQAGIGAPPATMDEFMEDAAKITTAVPGKFGYCLRGAKGGYNGWIMFMAAENGTKEWFKPDGTSTFNEPGAQKGMQFLVDMYQKGYAPKDSISWAFNEVVAGFYSGTCAMLDQDPDALIGIAQRMDKADFAVAPMPVGPAGKAFPTIGYSGWAMFHSSKDKEASWKLIAYLSNAKSNLEWAKFVGLIPTHKGADEDPYYHGDNFAGWFQELNDPKYDLMLPPVYLPQLGQFVDLMVVSTSQELLLGKRSVQDVSNQWAKFLTDAQKQWLAQNKQ